MRAPLNHAEIVDKVIELLEGQYIFLEIAQEISARLREQLPQYNDIDADTLAEEVMDILQELSKDKHLRFKHDPETAALLRRFESESSDPSEFLQSALRDNFGFHKVEWLPGRIGYLDLRAFPSPEHAGDLAVSAMGFLANAKALIFDLRHNGGGDPQMIQLITSYLFPPEIRHLNSFYFRAGDSHTHFWTLPYVPGKRLPDADVYVLTSDYTFSGAEEFAYNIKAMERGTLIGETTKGGAHPGGTHAIGEQFTLFVPSGRAINPVTKTNWEGVGVEPHIKVPANEALKVARKMALEKLLEKTTDEKEKQSLNEALAALKGEAST